MNASEERAENGVGRKRFLEERREWKLSGLLYAYDLVSCSEPEENLKVMVFRKRSMKINADKNKLMVLNRKENLEIEVDVNRMQLEHVSEFKYLVCLSNESGTD